MMQSQLEIIEQAIIYLQSISENDYVKIISPRFESSAGSHIRHIIDHYESIRTGYVSGIIDYSIRSRGSLIEQKPQLAIEKLTSTSNWISELKDSDFDKAITLLTEVSISKKKVIKVKSNLKRELIFAAGHAIHHYAIISQISKYMTSNNIQVNFGLAPATATFMRDLLDSEYLQINSVTTSKN